MTEKGSNNGGGRRKATVWPQRFARIGNPNHVIEITNQELKHGKRLDAYQFYNPTTNTTGVITGQQLEQLYVRAAR